MYTVASILAVVCVLLDSGLQNKGEVQGCARGLFSWDRGETEILKPKTEALTIQADARPRPRPSELETETRPRRTAYQLRGETEPRHHCASRRPQDRGVKTEATSHIHVIPRTDVVLKRNGGRLELRLNQSGIFKHNFIYVNAKMLCLNWTGTCPYTSH